MTEGKRNTPALATIASAYFAIFTVHEENEKLLEVKSSLVVINQAHKHFCSPRVNRWLISHGTGDSSIIAELDYAI